MLFGKQDYDPYYRKLSSSQKKVYNDLCKAIECGKAEVSVRTKIYERELPLIFNAINCEHPEFFWFDYSYQGYKIKLNNMNQVTDIGIYYNVLRNNLIENKARFNQKVNEILKLVEKKNVLGVEAVIHHYLSVNTTYTEGPLDQTAYDVIVNHKGVCAGYSRAFQHLMKSCGIPCYYCRGIVELDKYSSEEKENHAWNIICLGGDYYNVDVTWSGGFEKVFGKDIVSYEFYNRLDRQLTTRERQGQSIDLPKCISTKYSYENIEGETWQETLLRDIMKKINPSINAPLIYSCAQYDNYVLECVSNISESGIYRIDSGIVGTDVFRNITMEHMRTVLQRKYQNMTFDVDAVYVQLSTDFFYYCLRLDAQFTKAAAYVPVNDIKNKVKEYQDIIKLVNERFSGLFSRDFCYITSDQRISGYKTGQFYHSCFNNSTIRNVKKIYSSFSYLLVMLNDGTFLHIDSTGMQAFEVKIRDFNCDVLTDRCAIITEQGELLFLLAPSNQRMFTTRFAPFITNLKTAKRILFTNLNIVIVEAASGATAYPIHQFTKHGVPYIKEDVLTIVSKINCMIRDINFKYEILRDRGEIYAISKKGDLITSKNIRLSGFSNLVKIDFIGERKLIGLTAEGCIVSEHPAVNARRWTNVVDFHGRGVLYILRADGMLMEHIIDNDTTRIVDMNVAVLLKKNERYIKKSGEICLLPMLTTNKRYESCKSEKLMLATTFDNYMKKE